MVGDPVGDFIIRIKNAGATGAPSLSVPYSQLKHAIAEKLVAEGYVKSVAKRGKKIKKVLDLELSYKEGRPRVSDVKRISKPGRRMYKKSNELYPIKFGKGATILSTPKGILTGEEAKKENVGGEELFHIW